MIHIVFLIHGHLRLHVLKLSNDVAASWPWGSRLNGYDPKLKLGLSARQETPLTSWAHQSIHWSTSCNLSFWTLGIRRNDSKGGAPWIRVDEEPERSLIKGYSEDDEKIYMFAMFTHCFQGRCCGQGDTNREIGLRVGWLWTPLPFTI